MFLKQLILQFIMHTDSPSMTCFNHHADKNELLRYFMNTEFYF